MVYEDIARELRDLIERAYDSFGMLVLEARVEHLLALVTRLKKDFGFELLLDVTAVDYPTRALRFEVVHHLYSRVHNRRVRVKTPLSEAQPLAPSLTHLYGSARFMERETHDMYGVIFQGNDDLRPILLYEGFVGHPLRKDYVMEAEQPIVPYRQ